MKLLIFDLDLTLVNTTSCHNYLKTPAGREAVVNLISTGEISTSLYYSDTVDYVNSLVSRYLNRETDTLPIIISDSPQSYCEAILEKHGFNIESRFVFGAANKPCVDIEKIYESIYSYNLDEEGPEECLVIGDSPKDIYFAHHINSPSVFASWGYVQAEYAYQPDSSVPTKKAENLIQLKEYVESFISKGEAAFEYEKPDFKNVWEINAVNMESYTAHHVDDIGYVKHYVPEALNTENTEFISTFFEVHWMMKRAKNVPANDLWRKVPQQFFTKKGTFKNASDLIRVAGSYKSHFKKWLEEKNVSGKVLLVPAPSSVPVECNKTYTVDLIAEWWTKWLNDEPGQANFQVIHYGMIIERFKPKIPTHAKNGERLIEEQLTTMGALASEVAKLPDDISCVVFLDDVSTSGQTIHAMATIFRELKIVPKETPLYGYVWYKTHHPVPEFDLSALIAIADQVAAEN